MSQDPDDLSGSGELALPSVDVLASAAEAKPPPEPPKPTYELLSFDELLALPEVEWIVQDLLKPEDLCMFFGAAGSGKTFAIIDLLLCLIGGRGFYADRLPVLKPCRVLYITTEGRGRIPARFRAAAAKHGIKPSPSQFQTCLKAMPNLGVWDTLDALLFDFRQKGFIPDVIVYDTFARATVGQEENPADSAKVHIENLERLRDELLKQGSLAVQIFLHHEAKGSGRARGSTVYEGAVDLSLRFRKEGGAFVMSFEKSKDADPLEDQSFSLTKHEEGSASITWGGTYVKSSGNGAARPPAEKAAEEAFLNHAAGPGQAKTLPALSIAAKGDDSLKKALERLVKKEPERFGSVSRVTYGPNAKPNRAALHYWLKAEDDQD